MDCPVCNIPLNHSEHLENHLTAQQCKQCGGHWVNSYQYWQWRDRQKKGLPNAPPNENEPIEVKDSQLAKLCPECGKILRANQVGHGLNFCLDRCANCGGFWFDKNEWTALRQTGLHLNTHAVFTKVWQRDIKKQQVKENYDRKYRNLFGEEEYIELKRIREWIYQHPEKQYMITFLLDEDPFSV